jgi:hypothetical protein
VFTSGLGIHSGRFRTCASVKREIPVDMKTLDPPVSNTGLDSKAETLKLIKDFQQSCEGKGQWTGSGATWMTLLSLFFTAATTVSAGIVSITDKWKWATVVISGLATVVVGLKDYFRFTTRHAFYRRAIVECQRLFLSGLQASTPSELQSIQDRFLVLRQNEAESAARVEAAQIGPKPS